ALELDARLIDREILGRIEDREVPSYRFLRPIPLDPFRTGVPAHDHAVRVECEDRVIAHALDQELIEASGLSDRPHVAARACERLRVSLAERGRGCRLVATGGASIAGGGGGPHGAGGR